MSFAIFLYTFLFILPLLSAFSFKIDAHVAHGINTFNNKPITNFTSASRLFSSFGPVPEIGVLNPGGTNASAITSETSLESLMATIDAYNFRMTLGFPQSNGPFNVPIAQSPTIFGQSADINDRIVPIPFSDSNDLSLIDSSYLSKGADSDITLGEWNRISGRMTGYCKEDGTSAVAVQIRNGLPNGIYTLWDVSVLNPLTDNE